MKAMNINYENSHISLRGKGIYGTVLSMKKDFSKKTQKNIDTLTSRLGIQWKNVFKINVPENDSRNSRFRHRSSLIIEGLGGCGMDGNVDSWVYFIDNHKSKRTLVIKNGEKPRKLADFITHLDRCDVVAVSKESFMKTLNEMEQSVPFIRFRDWFDPDNKKHLEALAYAKNGGTCGIIEWPIGFIPKYVILGNDSISWAIVKVANKYLNIKLGK